MREWMTINEASSLLGISEPYIRSHIKKGCLDSDRYGYPVRLKASETDIFLLPFDSI